MMTHYAFHNAHECFILGLASWSGERFFRAEIEHYRLAVLALKGSRKDVYAAIGAKVNARVFASSFADDLNELRDFGLGRHADSLVKSITQRISGACSVIDEAELAAGFVVPAIRLSWLPSQADRRAS